MNYRPIKLSDYENLISFWKENYFVNEVDDLDRFKLFLEKNPDLSVLAEENGKITGTILGSFDGRRGYIQKLVVDRNYRKKGIGKLLIDRVIKKLRELDVLYIPISIEEELVPFYEKCGFKKTKQVPMNISYSTYTHKKF
jgi:ribosomal protein S18 acetylase RimI-like enzyme